MPRALCARTGQAFRNGVGVTAQNSNDDWPCPWKNQKHEIVFIQGLRLRLYSACSRLCCFSVALLCVWRAAGLGESWLARRKEGRKEGSRRARDKIDETRRYTDDGQRTERSGTAKLASSFPSFPFKILVVPMMQKKGLFELRSSHSEGASACVYVATWKLLKY